MSIPSFSFWKNKKVIITGHTGFTGSWLTQVLIFFGAKIYGISLKPNTNPSLFKILKIKNKINGNYLCDINDYNKVKKIFKKINPHIVFHLAAQPIVKSAFKNPIKTFHTNILGTANICDACRNLKNLNSLLLITTDKVYENKIKSQKRSFNENDRLGGDEPYSSSKVGAEMVIRSYINLYLKKKNLKINIARAGNIIGGGDWGLYRLIPDVFRALHHNKKLIIRNPISIRPWQHVLDAVNGYILLAESRRKGSWNFGPLKNQKYRVIDLLKIFKKKKKNLKWTIKKDKKLKETVYLNLNIKKSIKNLKWKPKWNFNNSLYKTIDWYSSFYKKRDMINITNKQIKEFYKL